MCPVCISTLALVAAGAASAGGLAAVVVNRVRPKHDQPALPAHEEEIR
jgi:hypothetical protein